MNEPISWDQSLVKKFSTSNHYKLLNQLRNEVKKYPLNNKKKTSSIQGNETNLDNKNKANVLNSKIISVSNNSNNSSEDNSNRSTVSFNNAKNFSIYNQNSNHRINRQNDNFVSDQLNSSDDFSSPTPTFKERLNDIDLK
tara:strand:- start:1126 stop:1545 length:420 start_codon:yes stop_codon:yes gene_type:complete